jgi:hypothetical protein
LALVEWVRVRAGAVAKEKAAWVGVVEWVRGWARAVVKERAEWAGALEWVRGRVQAVVKGRAETVMQLGWAKVLLEVNLRGLNQRARATQKGHTSRVCRLWAQGCWQEGWARTALAFGSARGQLSSS